jgi:hypothetical protein
MTERPNRTRQDYCVRSRCPSLPSRFPLLPARPTQPRPAGSPVVGWISYFRRHPQLHQTDGHRRRTVGWLWPLAAMCNTRPGTVRNVPRMERRLGPDQGTATHDPCIRQRGLSWKLDRISSLFHGAASGPLARIGIAWGSRRGGPSPPPKPWLLPACNNFQAGRKAGRNSRNTRRDACCHNNTLPVKPVASHKRLGPVLERFGNLACGLLALTYL